MLEPRSDLATFNWRRTAFARIDGAVDIAEDDWSLAIDGMSAARIYRVRGGPQGRNRLGPGSQQPNGVRAWGRLHSPP